MSMYPFIEQHYIIIGHTNYQTVYAASLYGHDIIIRGKFEWDPEVPSKVKRIDFMLDNLNDIEEKYYLTDAHWCTNQNRIELHLLKGSSDEVRSTASEVIPSGFDFDEMAEMELILRIGEDIEVCEEFVMWRTNEKITDPSSKKQQDKDGTILIGITRR